jgi:haloacetate dehalogenase
MPENIVDMLHRLKLRSPSGGPLAIWRAWANDVRGGPLDAGHFFPEEIPGTTAEELGGSFFAATA